VAQVAVEPQIKMELITHLHLVALVPLQHQQAQHNLEHLVAAVMVPTLRLLYGLVPVEFTQAVAVVDNQTITLLLLAVQVEVQSVVVLAAGLLALVLLAVLVAVVVAQDYLLLALLVLLVLVAQQVALVEQAVLAVAVVVAVVMVQLLALMAVMAAMAAFLFTTRIKEKYNDTSFL
jgi:hypothetical protein